MRQYIPNSFQMPNVFIDKLLRFMDPYEYTIFSVIVRKTVGWNKESDKISLSQIEEISAIKRRTVIKKTASLSEKGFVEVVKNPGFPNEYAISKKLFDENFTPEINQGSAPDAPGVVHQMHGGSAPDAPTKPTKQNPLTKPTNKTQGAAALFSDLENLGIGADDRKSLIDKFGYDRVALEVERLIWKNKFPGSAPVKSVLGWLKGSCATEGGYAIPDAHRFVSRAQAEAIKAERAAAEREAREKADAKAAAARAEMLAFDAVYDSLPADEKAKLHDATMQFWKFANSFGWKYYTDRKAEGVQDEHLIGFVLEMKGVRSDLIRERYPHLVPAEYANDPDQEAAQDVASIIAKSLAEAE